MHSKFVEGHRGLLSELLDELHAPTVDRQTAAGSPPSSDATDFAPSPSSSLFGCWAAACRGSPTCRCPPTNSGASAYPSSACS
ncbi:MAG: hypothetical protein M0037_00615 [Betaproteobacteria bacterium]|nr:hypothetical protein [Betaproteobacteria bacterium]